MSLTSKKNTTSYRAEDDFFYILPVELVFFWAKKSNEFSFSTTVIYAAEWRSAWYYIMGVPCSRLSTGFMFFGATSSTVVCGGKKEH